MARSNSWVWGRSLAGNADSKPAGDIGVFLLYVLRVWRCRHLRLADHSSRGVLLTVLCVTECDRKASTVTWPQPILGGSTIKTEI